MAEMMNEQNLQNLPAQLEECQMQRDALERRCVELEARVAAVEQSLTWRLTKPFRRAFSVLCRVAQKSRILRKVGKALRCLKNKSFVYTVKRTYCTVMAYLGVYIPPYRKKDLQAQREATFEKEVKFSVLVPLYNTPKKFLKEMIQSVIDQTYANWELCLADASDVKHAYVEKICREYAEKDSRIRYARLEKNLGIAQNTNACAEMATGDYIALLDHDDLLSPCALYFNAKAICEKDADVLYSDEDHLSVYGGHVFPLRKPDWSPDLLYSQMYTCHLCVIRKSLFEQIGGFSSDCDGSQDYDLMLRLSEQTERICHIPAILYTWRESPGSTAANASAKPYAHEAGRKALDAHLKRRYGEHAYAGDSPYTFVFDARFGTLAEKKPCVSIIIPFKDHSDMTDACVHSILEKTTYENYEILLLDNRSDKQETENWLAEIVKVDDRITAIKADMPFNWSRVNNFGAAHAKGDVYVFLNNDIVVNSPDWLERLAENALRPETGVVGGLLTYEDETIQHAGVVVGMNGYADHIFKGLPTKHVASPYVSPMVSRNVLAVTGACLAISKEKMNKIGGFDESFIICGSDVELGLRAHEFGYFNRYDANVRLYHLESKSRDSYIPPIDFKRSLECYAPYLNGNDPYFNVNLRLDSLLPREELPL